MLTNRYEILKVLYEPKRINFKDSKLLILSVNKK